MEAMFRKAVRSDVPAIVELLADDDIGAGREVTGAPLPESYWRAFEAIDADARQLLVVGEQEYTGNIVATLQISLIPYLTHGGSERAQIEGVRVRRDLRGNGIGEKMIEWVVDHARRQGCRTVQLTTDKRRVDAQRFYKRLGFAPTHEGMKLEL
jgi:GNAT superfamily N-acetyltransferase